MTVKYQKGSGSSTSTGDKEVAVETKAWAVTDAKDRDGLFAVRGDSGAAVVDALGVAVGMIVAEGRDQLKGIPSCLTFVIPMEEILNHIAVRYTEMLDQGQGQGQGQEGEDGATNALCVKWL